MEASLEGGGSKPPPVQGSPMVVASLAGDGLSASPCGGGPVEKALLTAGAAAQVRETTERYVRYTDGCISGVVSVTSTLITCPINVNPFQHESRMLAQATSINVLFSECLYYTLNISIVSSPELFYFPGYHSPIFFFSREPQVCFPTFARTLCLSFFFPSPKASSHRLYSTLDTTRVDMKNRTNRSENHRNS